MPSTLTSSVSITPKQQGHFLRKLIQKIKAETQLAAEDKLYLAQM